jgi:hypothetical protein
VRHFAYFPLSHDSDSDVAEAALLEPAPLWPNAPIYTGLNKV